MAVPHTQIASFEDEVLSGNQDSIREKVFNFIKLASYPPTDREIARQFSLPPGRVSARRGDLVKLGLVKESLVRECDVTGRKVKTWEVVR